MATTVTCCIQDGWRGPVALHGDRVAPLIATRANISRAFFDFCPPAIDNLVLGEDTQSAAVRIADTAAEVDAKRAVRSGHHFGKTVR